ncbi:DUF2927 domain-containing protein [Celeribacter arenosi]|uniref:DUF2927 domain-containing protein n=1 Tax=Celeribacter arenosi TaxID=792649 RepID=A0ABP7JSA5_9RHOB
MPRAQNLRCLGAGAFALALSACVPAIESPKPAARPTTVSAPSAQAKPETRPSAQSRALSQYYRDLQSDLLANDLLRTDGGGPDTPFSARTLARNFEDIALFDEYASINGQYVTQTTPTTLHRWDDSVRLGLVFGESVSAAQRSEDRKTLTALAARLSAATGHPIGLNASPNFTIFIIGHDDRAGLGAQIAQRIPGISAAALRTVETLPRSIYCLAFASDPDNDGVYERAVAVIRAEHPSLLRRACLHEEVAQGLGLGNDSPHARPSIFNDDEEFALLTRHDELLLSILYDPRLSPGMNAQTARPIVARIAQELLEDAPTGSVQ